MPVYRDLGYHFPVFRRDNNEANESQYWKRFIFETELADGGTAGTADEALLAGAAKRMKVIAAYVVSIDGDITGQNTNYASVNVVNRGSGGSGTDTVASYDMTSGNDAGQYELTALTLSGTAANLVIERGEVVTAELTKTSSGLAVNDVAVVLVCKAIE